MRNNITLGNKDILSIILNLEKNMSNNYSILMNEASNDLLYNYYFDMFERVKDGVRDIYEVMLNEGLYDLEEVDSSKINFTLEEFEKYLKEID